MINIWWNDFKRKLMGGNPTIAYIAINILVFLVVKLFSIESLTTSFFAFPASPSLWLSRFYTPITYQFLHTDFFVMLFNMLWLYWMGQLLLDFTKNRQFHIIYLGGGLISAIIYALVVNLFPNSGIGFLFGSSASLMAILAATATLIPNYSVQLMLFGFVRVKFIVLVYMLLDIVGAISVDKAAGLAHISGALFGFAFIKLLQSGTDLSSFFKKKPKLKVVRNNAPRKQSSAVVNQNEVDAVLDKISKSGYEKLTKEEKDILFRASKN